MPISTSDAALLRSSNLFDIDWYKKMYLDVDMLGMDPVEHYLWLGIRLGRNPSLKFCSRSYLEANPDVKRMGINPLVHYLRCGQKENRPVYPVLTQEDKHARITAKRIVKRRHIDWNDKIEQRAIYDLSILEYQEDSNLVSIIMPTRNRAYCIGHAIESVISQTHSNFELIVVDDGSTDNTEKVITSINDPRIRYIKNTESGGPSKARNIGLRTARGEWVFFLDSDNAWRCNMIEFMLKHARRSQISAGYCAANLQDDRGQRKAVLYADFDYESCLKENFIDLNCFFLRREGRFRDIFFDENLRRLVDWDFILRIGAHTRIVGLPYIGVDYYDGANDRVSNREHTQAGELGDLVTSIRARAKSYLTEAAPIRDLASYRVAVVLHVFHPERVEECIRYLKNIDFEFDLFVTTPLKESEPCIASIIDVFPRAFLFRYPNAGADIAPFLELMSTLKNYWLVCKIHTKRDVGRWGDTWRSVLLRSVLNSTDLINEIVTSFKLNPQLKLVCSKDFYKHGVKNSIPETLNQVKKLAADMGMADLLSREWAFVAGTMFWVRPQEYFRLGRYMCDSQGYSTIFRQDGALEHGLERMFGLCISAQERSRVGLVTDGTVEEFPVGVGHTNEGVSVTLTRLAA
ncbi:rhamnan synthesis F family protein [Chelativorans xinjiangense]|uniref:rhamnan synthesis F family protein n=1 Tax=Chelativorans xinjiangense TaxID=2681485 RepID=UPI0013567B4C|nr:rhamnan synthesis F family protein [Chelativorans xinjiangense]